LSEQARRELSPPRGRQHRVCAEHHGGPDREFRVCEDDHTDVEKVRIVVPLCPAPDRVSVFLRPGRARLGLTATRSDGDSV